MNEPVLGIDLSLTATGVAAVFPDGGFEVDTIRSTGRRADTVAQRADRITWITDSVLAFADQQGYFMAVLEGPAITRQGGSTWDRAWLWGQVVLALGHRNVAVASPSTVKRWAAGKGNADKAAVAVGVARLWPSFECRSDNEADALALASMGAQRIHVGQVPRRAHHGDCLSKVEWPQTVLDRDAIAEDVGFERTQDAAEREETA